MPNFNRKALRKLIVESGNSVRSFAKLINVGYRTVYYWLSGEKTPYPKNITAICEKFNMNESELYEGADLIAA